MLSVGNTIEAAAEGSGFTWMSVGGSNVSPSFFHSISIGISPEEIVQDTWRERMHFPNLVFLPKTTHLTAVALFQVAVKGEGRYFWRLDGPQKDVAGCLLSLAV